LSYWCLPIKSATYSPGSWFFRVKIKCKWMQIEIIINNISKLQGILDTHFKS